MYTEHTYAVKNPQNVEILKKQKKFKFLMKKTKLTFESFFISPECSYHFRNHNEQLKRPPNISIVIFIYICGKINLK